MCALDECGSSGPKIHGVKMKKSTNNSSEKEAVCAYLKMWKDLIKDLGIMVHSNSLNYGNSSALLLACCYMEALGKLDLYNGSNKHPGTKQIFIRTMRWFNISKSNAEKVYKHFRCDSVHAGPASSSTDINDTDGSDITINLDWFIASLSSLADKVEEKYKDKPLHNIACALDWSYERSNAMDRSSFCEELKNIIKDIFPENAELKCYDIDIVISWKLNNDKNRPNKRSKTIKIIITEEFFEDYRDNTEDKQKAAREGFKKYIKTKYENFEPDHDEQKYQPPPMEEWVQLTSDLNK